MKLQLSQIKASPKPIRSSFDDAKLNELILSMVQEGQVEPIGVHANSHGYTIVWGHRRTEAARRAGWTEIEAVIVPQDEVNNLIQAGIENLTKEEMSADDKAEWAQRLIDLGLSQNEISRRSSIPRRTIDSWIVYRREIAMGVGIDTNQNDRDEGVMKIRHIASIFGDDIESKKIIAKKVSDDSLNRDQTRAVAEAYRDAKTPEVKAAVLKAPIISRDTAADILRRSIHRVEMEGGIASQQETNDWQKEREERRTMESFDFAVKEFLDSARLFLQVAQKGTSLVKYGKYSPEAARYAMRQIDKIIDVLKTYREELEQVK